MVLPEGPKMLLLGPIGSIVQNFLPGIYMLNELIMKMPYVVLLYLVKTFRCESISKLGVLSMGVR